MTLQPTFNRTWITILLVVSAAVFTVGVAVERSTVHIDSHAAVVSSSSGKTSGEQTSSSSSEGSAQHVEASGVKESGSTTETIFGLNTESTGLVVAAIAVSLGLAFAVWLWNLSVLLLLVFAFGLGAAIFDARELVHQLQESRGTLVFLASLTALLHLGVAVFAVRVWQRSSQQSTSVMGRA